MYVCGLVGMDATDNLLCAEAARGGRGFGTGFLAGWIRQEPACPPEHSFLRVQYGMHGIQ